MDFIKEYFYKLLHLIDDKRFLIKPLKWLYYFKGILPYILPLLFIYFFISDNPAKYYSTWAKVVSWIFFVLFTVYLFIVAYINMLFWFQRAGILEKVVRPGDDIVAIPLVADNIKNDGESLAIMLSTIVIVGAIMLYVFLMLTGEEEFYKYGNFAYGLLAIIGLIIACAVISYFIILVTHLIAERLRMRAQMCNDLRDVADIHRASALEDEMDEMPPAIPEIPTETV